MIEPFTYYKCYEKINIKKILIIDNLDDYLHYLNVICKKDINKVVINYEMDQSFNPQYGFIYIKFNKNVVIGIKIININDHHRNFNFTMYVNENNIKNLYESNIYGYIPNVNREFNTFYELLEEIKHILLVYVDNLKIYENF
jgi:hypothetical protein